MAYVDDEPAGSVAVAPRLAYPKLRTLRLPWTGRDEDKDDTGVGGDLPHRPERLPGPRPRLPTAKATIDFARGRGARALEAYPMITQPGKEMTCGEMHVGARQVFEDAGFEKVSHPTVRRVVMWIDFEQPASNSGSGPCKVLKAVHTVARTASEITAADVAHQLGIDRSGASRFIPDAAAVGYLCREALPRRRTALHPRRHRGRERLCPVPRVAGREIPRAHRRLAP